MLTIDRIAALDRVLHAIINAMDKAVNWLSAKHDQFVTDCAYRVVEAKAKDVEAAGNLADDLTDKKVELKAAHIEAKQRLQASFKEALAALDKSHKAALDEVDTELADAAWGIVEAERAYDAAQVEAINKLGVDVA